MNRRQFLRMTSVVAILTVSGQGLATAIAAPQKPNIVLINADDLGYGDVGCYGATKVKTPNIDRLARQGRMFTDAHSASAVCSPSRYALMTGAYSFRKGTLWAPVFLRSTLVIDPRKLTIGKVMKEAGYETACIGKWHLGFGSKGAPDWNKPLKPGPLELGFDYYFGVPVVNSYPPFLYVENHHVVGLTPEDPLVYGKRNTVSKHYREKWGFGQLGGGKAAHALYQDEAVGTTLTQKAVKWLKEQKGKPFFLYMATTHIHHPFTPAPRFKGTSECGPYGDFIHELDWMVGEVLAALDEMEVADNTLVIFTSDNGGMLNQGGQAAWKKGHRMNSDFLGFKFDAWEGGHRIPFIARWPGKIPAGTTSDALICNVDMLATMAEIAGRKLASSEGPDSFNVLPALTGTPKQPIRDHLVLCPRQSGWITIRKDNWLYIPAQGNGGFKGINLGQHTLGGPAAHRLTKQVNSDIEDGKIKEDAPPAQLYDLKADRSQTKNVYREHPKIVAELKAILDQCQKSDRTAPRSSETQAGKSAAARRKPSARRPRTASKAAVAVGIPPTPKP